MNLRDQLTYEKDIISYNDPVKLFVDIFNKHAKSNYLENNPLKFYPFIENDILYIRLPQENDNWVIAIFDTIKELLTKYNYHIINTLNITKPQHIAIRYGD